MVIPREILEQKARELAEKLKLDENGEKLILQELILLHDDVEERAYYRGHCSGCSDAMVSL